jgi:transposase-like protein
MPVELTEQILTVLRTTADQNRPMTISQLARRFGANPQLIAGCARQLVDNGSAQPSMVMVNGVLTLHGLMPTAAPATTS